MGTKKRKDFNRQIFMSIFTALLAAILSVLGFYFNSKIQAKDNKIQKQFEYKSAAYNSFLTSTSKSKSPIIAEILSIGYLSKHVATDSEIQSLEDSFEKLVKLNLEYDISWQLDSNFNILRLHGSETVRNNCNDILAVLALRQNSVNWKKYPSELQTLRKKWIENQKGFAYGYKTKVSDDERIMLILLSSLYKNLIKQLRTELQE